MSLERGLDGRALPIEVRAGNVFFLDPDTGRAAVRADLRRTRSPASSCRAPAPRASTSSTTRSRTRRCSSEPRRRASSCRDDMVLRSTSSTTAARTSSSGGRRRGVQPGRGRSGPRVNLESSVGTRYDALLASLERRCGGGQGCGRPTAWRGAQLRERRPDPVRRRPDRPNDLGREYGPTPNEQRHRLALSGSLCCALRASQLSGIWTFASGVPMDILMPRRHRGFRRCRATPAGASSRRPASSTPTSRPQRRGRRQRRAAAARERRRALQRQLRLRSTCGCRGRSRCGGSVSVEAIVECFNVFNVTNILGVPR